VGQGTPRIVRIAYFDCFSGISGDMTLGALIDAGVNRDAISQGIQSLGLSDCRLTIETVMRGAFRATHVRVHSTPEHAHRHLRHVLELIDRSDLTERQRKLAGSIFQRLAQAEAKVHGTTIEKVHFHEVGAVDSIADIVGSAVGLDLLGADRIVAGPVPTGQGNIRIAHGTVALPAPGTAELLRGVPLRDVPIEAELTTPTGAAILTSVADAFGPLPAMTIEAVGYGAGSRDLQQQPNVLRLFVGHDAAAFDTDEAWMLETNLDDVAGEMVGYCIGRLWSAGALDVFTTPVQMKKDRPGVRLAVLCDLAQVEKLETILFQETGTLGIRRWPVARHKLRRQPHRVRTHWGEVQGKLGRLPDGTASFAPEYDACREIAQRHGVPLREVYRAALGAFEAPSDTEEAD
jgi:uncharacterized protein (TIGR00299 family) protein